MSDNWGGQPKVAEEHRTLGTRAWCFTDKTYCYETALCDCCLEASGWVPLWLRPDGVIVDMNEKPITTIPQAYCQICGVTYTPDEVDHE